MRSILLVEDSDDDVLFMRRACKKAAIQNSLVVAEDGRKAIDYLEDLLKNSASTPHSLPCLILLDLKLPRVGGLDVLKWIRQRSEFNRIPIIILTSSREDKDVTEAYNHHANAFKVKPSNANDLCDFVKALSDFWLKHDQSCLDN